MTKLKVTVTHWTCYLNIFQVKITLSVYRETHAISYLIKSKYLDLWPLTVWKMIQIYLRNIALSTKTQTLPWSEMPVSIIKKSWNVWKYHITFCVKFLKSGNFLKTDISAWYLRPKKKCDLGFLAVILGFRVQSRFSKRIYILFNFDFFGYKIIIFLQFFCKVCKKIQERS